MSTNEMIGIVIVALGTIITLFAQVSKPMAKAVEAITKLNESVNHLIERFDRFEINNHDDHKRIWQKNDEQDRELSEHDKRISLLEKNVED